MQDSIGQGGATGVLEACSCCGLLQELPDLRPDHRFRCARCRTPLPDRRKSIRSDSRASAFATAALILYPFGIGLPLLRVEQYGYLRDTSVIDGVASLYAHGDVAVATIVLLCSVVIPLGKLLAILTLTSRVFDLAGHHRAVTYRLVEWTGRWGMLDVLVVAVLVAVLKLGDLVEVKPGSGALAFASVVILSLLATAFFDPHSLWDSEEQPT